MNTRNLFILTAIVAGLFGLAFVLIPEQSLSLYEIDLTAAGLYMSQLLGAAFIAIALVSWGVRNEKNTPARQGVLLAFFVGDIVGAVLTVIAMTNNLANALGWTTVVIYLVLGLGAGYFRFIKPD